MYNMHSIVYTECTWVLGDTVDNTESALINVGWKYYWNWVNGNTQLYGISNNGIYYVYLNSTNNRSKDRQ